MLKPKEILARDICEASHIFGQFKLRSGEQTNEYFDKYLFEADPSLLWRIGEQLAALIPENAEVLAGLEMGGIPIVTILSQLRECLLIAFLLKGLTREPLKDCVYAPSGAEILRECIINRHTLKRNPSRIYP